MVFPKNYYRKLNNIFYAITISVANRNFHYNRSNKIARYFFSYNTNSFCTMLDEDTTFQEFNISRFSIRKIYWSIFTLYKQQPRFVLALFFTAKPLMHRKHFKKLPRCDRNIIFTVLTALDDLVLQKRNTKYKYIVFSDWFQILST